MPVHLSSRSWPTCTYRIRSVEAREDIYRFPGWHTYRHRLWAIDTGSKSCMVRVGGKVYRRNECSVALYAPGITYEEYMEAGSFISWAWLLIEEKGIPSALEKLTGNARFRLFHDPSQGIRKKIESILEVKNEAFSVRPLKWSALLYDILGTLFELQLKSSAMHPERKIKNEGVHPWRQTVHRMLEESSTQKLTASDLAKALGISLSALTHQYRAQCGESMQDTIHSWRLEKARILLKRPDLSIKQVAGRIGISQQSYFSLYFKNATGYSPSDYRKFI